MTSVFGPMLDLCKLIADCQLQQENSKLHAVIIHDADKLWCFFRKIDGSYTAMTEQGSTDDQALWFPAKAQIFVKNCLPSVIMRTNVSSGKDIAFLDMETGWDHEQLLKDWAKSRSEIARHQGIFVRAFRMDGSNHPIMTAESKLLRTQEEPFFAPKPAPLKPASSKTASAFPQETLRFDDIRDVPAEFAYFVWKSRKSAVTRHQSNMKAWRELDQAERSLTTREIAARMYENPSVVNVLSVFKQLREGIPQHLDVPMIGFDQKWLFATSHLTAYSDKKLVDLNSANLVAMRFQRYKKATSVRQPGNDRLSASVVRCLTAAFGGLRLFDLTEDVICDLTGKIRITLSLADACCVREIITNN